MTQEAPWPTILEDLVNRTVYRPGWTIKLKEKQRDTGSPDPSSGLTLSIYTEGYDSYNVDRGQTYRVEHQFSVPPATYNEQSWLRWLFEQYLIVERHEAMEFFALWSGEPCTCSLAEPGRMARNCSYCESPAIRPFAPNHGPGHDPYIIHDYSTDDERRTRYTGVLNG